MELYDVKKHIGQLKADAEAGHEGSLVDLANILLRVIHNFEHKGRDYVFDRYWDRRATEMEKEARLDIAEFIYQAMVTGVDQQILSIMDVNDVHFVESIRTAGLLKAHNGLKRYLEHLFEETR